MGPFGTRLSGVIFWVAKLFLGLNLFLGGKKLQAKNNSGQICLEIFLGIVLEIVLEIFF